MTAIRELLEKCKELDAKATEGPWERYNLIGDAGGLRRVAAIKLDPPPLPCQSPERKQVAVASVRSEDAAFIAFARTALPKLVEAVEGLLAERDEAVAALHEATERCVAMRDDLWRLRNKYEPGNYDGE